MRRILILTFLFVAVLGSGLSQRVYAQSSSANNAKITLDRTTEDGIALLRATVLVDGKPLEDATVQIYTKRTFGNLPLGEDQTFDDGTVFFPLPDKLPPAKEGQLSIVAQIIKPAAYAGTQTQIVIDGAPLPGEDQPPFPDRALWRASAPLSLIATLFGLLGGVWLTYAYVVSIVNNIRKGT